tara:strand:+ start:536 stop:1327 length:792 start_codon:yes stop_codon:yes gene_type:complete
MKNIPNILDTNKTNIIYQRVSSKGQETNTSLAYQKKRLETFCNDNNIKNITSISDVDSGGNANRTGIKQIEHLIQADIINTIYITKLDRLYRSVLDGAKFIHLCLEHNVDIQATDEPISTKSPVEMLQINLLLSIADFERSNIKIRTNQGKQSSYELGNRPHGNIPFGYNSKMEIEPNSAAVINKLFRRYNKSNSLTDVKNYLNRNGYTTARNKPFRRKSIYNILKNPTYAGFISFNNQSKVGNHIPIISKRLFTSVNKALSK